MYRAYIAVLLAVLAVSVGGQAYLESALPVTDAPAAVMAAVAGLSSLAVLGVLSWLGPQGVDPARLRWSAPPHRPVWRRARIRAITLCVVAALCQTLLWVAVFGAVWAVPVAVLAVAMAVVAWLWQLTDPDGQVRWLVWPLAQAVVVVATVSAGGQLFWSVAAAITIVCDVALGAKRTRWQNVSRLTRWRLRSRAATQAGCRVASVITATTLMDYQAVNRESRPILATVRGRFGVVLRSVSMWRYAPLTALGITAVAAAMPQQLAVVALGAGLTVWTLPVAFRFAPWAAEPALRRHYPRRARQVITGAIIGHLIAGYLLVASVASGMAVSALQVGCLAVIPLAVIARRAQAHRASPVGETLIMTPVGGFPSHATSRIFGGFDVATLLLTTAVWLG